MNRITPVIAALAAGLVLAGCPAEPDYELVPMDLHVSEDFGDFGDVPTGVSITRTLRVHNAGDADLVLSQVPYVRQEGDHQTFALEGTWEVIEPDADDEEPTVVIDARSYEEMTLTFTPVAQEESFGYVGLYSNDPDEANRVIVLRGGSYAGTPQVQVSPGLVEFGFVAAGNSSEQYVEVRNTGEVDVEVVDVSIGGTDSPFEVGGVSGFPIPPGDGMLIPVLFHSDGGAVIDELTDNSDDDGDGYAEVDGDCHDDDIDIHPGAVEEPDFFDNDCDGTIDEGTVNYDDDGDGYSEALGDCDDAEAAVYSGALEWCDNLDNDCDGQTDEDCIDDTPPLEIVGGIQASVVAMNMNPADPVELCVTTVHGPDACLEYEWWVSGGEFVTLDGACVTWQPPTDEMGDFSVYCRVSDECSTDEELEDYAFITLVVTRLYVPPPTPECSADPTGRGSAAVPLSLLLLGGLLIAARRR